MEARGAQDTGGGGELSMRTAITRYYCPSSSTINYLTSPGLLVAEVEDRGHDTSKEIFENLLTAVTYFPCGIVCPQAQGNYRKLKLKPEVSLV